MNVDDLIFVAPNEIGREDLHEARQNQEIDLMLLDQTEGIGLRLQAVLPRDFNEGQPCLRRQRLEIVAIRQHESGFYSLELPTLCRLQKLSKAMRLLCDQDGHALAASRFCETHLDLHLEFLS